MGPLQGADTKSEANREWQTNKSIWFLSKPPCLCGCISQSEEHTDKRTSPDLENKCKIHSPQESF